VVRGLNSGKALGSDGFTIALFQKFWEVLKENIMAMFSEFHSRRQF
jgi:hypothetical protein